MKLCWLLPSDRSGGITPVVLSCCHQATEAGHEATMLLLTAPSWLKSKEFRVASLNLSGGTKETPQLLLQWLTENPQDIIFLNDCDEFEPIIPYLPPTLKCVYVIHDTAPKYWNTALAQEENLDAMVAVSKTVASKFSHGLKRSQKLSVIYNGAIFPELPASPIARSDDLIFLGGGNPMKGAFDVLQLWPCLIKLGFTGKLHWFGHCSPELKTQISELPHGERIHVYGYVQRELIFSIAASTKVLLMLSRVEPFGMATIEAMSMGCIPVAWDIETGTKEIISANETGLFAPLGDLQYLAKQVLYACENHANFSTAIIELARSNFNETVMWQGYEVLIQKLSTLAPLERTKNGEQPILYQPPIRRFQLLPSGLRSVIREFVGRSPTLGYWLRDMRGW
jgi:glycosyltransferase involved in cell wall biosynthesis